MQDLLSNTYLRRIFPISCVVTFLAWSADLTLCYGSKRCILRCILSCAVLIPFRALTIEKCTVHLKENLIHNTICFVFSCFLLSFLHLLLDVFSPCFPFFLFFFFFCGVLLFSYLFCCFWFFLFSLILFFLILSSFLFTCSFFFHVAIFPKPVFTQTVSNTQRCLLISKCVIAAMHFSSQSKHVHMHSCSCSGSCNKSNVFFPCVWERI